MLLNWGELGTAFVVDPEYLGNMEAPRTTTASRAGLRTGYGSGIYSMLELPYPMLGHNGGIEGFYSTYAYSPSRDVGFVVLLNSTGPTVADAARRLNSLAVRYLKRDIDAPVAAEARVDAAVLDRYVGYYHEANPRNQIFWPAQWLFGGRHLFRDAAHLYSDPLWGATRERLVPVTETLFRLEREHDASMVFTVDDHGVPVLAGNSIYAEKQPRWRVELVRMPVLSSAALLLTVFGVAGVWVARIRRAQPHGFWALKSVLLLCPLALVVPFLALASTPGQEWGDRNAATIAVFVGSLALPALALAAALLAFSAYRHGASRLLVTYAAAITIAVAVISSYLASSGLLGMRLWMY
jgi:hypothetical protein